MLAHIALAIAARSAGVFSGKAISRLASARRFCLSHGPISPMHVAPAPVTQAVGSALAKRMAPASAR